MYNFRLLDEIYLFLGMNSTMAVPSFKMDSPSMRVESRLLAPNSRRMATTATGSVALITAPNISAMGQVHCPRPISSTLTPMSSAAVSPMESVWAYFTIEKFKWNTSLIGYSLAVIGLLSIVVQLWLVGILVKKLGDRRMALLGLILTMTGFFLFAFTEWQWLLLGALLIYIIGGVQGTAIQSITSSIIPDNEQGELQGSLGSLMGLTTLIAPPLMTSCFSYFTGKNSAIYFPGISFLIAALLTLISLILLIKSFIAAVLIIPSSTESNASSLSRLNLLSFPIHVDIRLFVDITE